MKFRYIGEEYTEFFGFKWMHGTEHDVTDAHAVNKLSNSVLFEKVDSEVMRKKPGPKPRVAEPAETSAE